MNPEELKVGDNLKIIEPGGTVLFYEITGVDDFFYKDNSYSSVAAGGTASFATVSNLNPPDNQIYYFNAIETLSNVRIQIKQPASTDRLGTNLAPQGGFLHDLLSTVGSGSKINIWVNRNNNPSTQLVNNTNVAITPVLWWKGKRFSVKNPSSLPPIYYTARVGAMAE